LTNPDEKSGYLDPTIVTALLHSEPDMDTFEIWTEVRLRNDSLIRADPNYRKSGPWYDFVNVQWENLLPARVLCFFNKREGDDDEPQALVHGVDERSVGKLSKGFSNSILTTHYRMDYLGEIPIIHSIPVASIDSAIMAFLHEPSELMFNAKSTGVMAVRPRNEWAYFWLAWNEELELKNRDQSKKKKPKYVSLADRNLLQAVRANAHKKLEIPITLG
jgi:hypothetical protein